MQVLLVVLATVLLVFAGYAWGRAAVSSESSSSVVAPREPDAVQVVVLIVFGLASIAGALALQGRGGLRMPVPARLDELAGRAEGVAVAKAEEAAEQS